LLAASAFAAGLVVFFGIPETLKKEGLAPADSAAGKTGSSGSI